MSLKENKSVMDDGEVLTELNRLLAEYAEPIQPAPSGQDALRQRLAERASMSLRQQMGLQTIRQRAGTWKKVTTGVRAKTLWNGPQGNSVLIELAAGAELPVHRHSWLEEGIVLHGDLRMGDLELGQFDYHVSPPGSRHERIGSRQGALAYLRGTALGNRAAVTRELLGGLWPGSGKPAVTVFATDIEWQPVCPLIERKQLWTDGQIESYFCRLDPGACLEGHLHSHVEECMMLSGELFLGDILLQAGDYHLAEVGSQHNQITSDVGALLFVRGQILRASSGSN